MSSAQVVPSPQTNILDYDSIPPRAVTAEALSEGQSTPPFMTPKPFLPGIGLKTTVPSGRAGTYAPAVPLPGMSRAIPRRRHTFPFPSDTIDLQGLGENTQRQGQRTRKMVMWSSRKVHAMLGVLKAVSRFRKSSKTNGGTSELY